MSVAIIIPAWNEEATVHAVASAALVAARTLGGRALVVADNCNDRTAELAELAGVEVLVRTTERSKAAAVTEGILATRADVTCLIDADCLGITPEAIVDMVMPVLDGRATMSVLTFDYGPWSWLVEYFPWSTGQRAFLTAAFPLHDPRLDGYNLEMLVNEGVGAWGGITVSRSLEGLRHRTKMAKEGFQSGVLDNRKMWTSIARSARSVDRAAYRAYVRNVVVDYDGEWFRPLRPVTAMGHAFFTVAAAGLDRWSPAGHPSPDGTVTQGPFLR